MKKVARRICGAPRVSLTFPPAPPQLGLAVQVASPFLSFFMCTILFIHFSILRFLGLAAATWAKRGRVDLSSSLKIRWGRRGEGDDDVIFPRASTSRARGHVGGNAEAATTSGQFLLLVSRAARNGNVVVLLVEDEEQRGFWF